MRESLKILLVEDDQIEAKAIQRAFRKRDIMERVHHVTDGVQALDALRDSPERPNLILLDLNLPRMNGFEFLEEIRNDNELKDAIVFVLSTSQSPEDICTAYEKNVAGYLIKSKMEENFGKLAEMLLSYSTTVEFPIRQDKL